MSSVVLNIYDMFHTTLCAYFNAHTTFHSRHRTCSPLFYSYSRLQHSSVASFFPNKNLEKTFSPLFTASSKIHSAQTLLGRPHLEADRNMVVRIHCQRAELTPGWKAGCISDVPVAFYVIHWFLHHPCVLSHTVSSTIWTVFISREFIDRTDPCISLETIV